MIDKDVFWVWAQHAFGEGSPKPWHIHNTFPGGLEGFYRAGAGEWCRLAYISLQQIESLRAFDLKAAMVRLQFAAQMRWQLLTPESEKYPPDLRNISDPPAVLYMKGEMAPLADAPWVAVVGARKASEASCQVARKIAHQLATAGVVVASGMAPGVDTAAQEGAMEAFGRTVCVAPVDLASPYLDRPGGLCRRVAERGGVLLSEYFSQRNPAQGGFHQRNRLLTGMCAAVVLVQAAEKGGTMLYARLAAKQGRPVYVYPGPPDDPAFAGSRALLAKGARPVESGWEIVEENPGWQRQGKRAAGMEASPGRPRRKPPRQAGQRAQGALSDRPPPGAPRPETPAPPGPGQPAGQDGELLALLEKELTVEELSARSGVEAGLLLRALARLELLGRVERGQNGRYRRI